MSTYTIEELVSKLYEIADAFQNQHPSAAYWVGAAARELDERVDRPHDWYGNGVSRQGFFP